MENNVALSFMDLAELSRDEKREIWMKRTGHSVAFLASLLKIYPSVLSRYLLSPEMPAVHHKVLVEYGVPPQLLPEPVYRPPGRKRIVPFIQPVPQGQDQA